MPRELNQTLLSITGEKHASGRQQHASELRERVRRDDRLRAQALAALVPTRPADVINAAERNVESTSRTFHRQVARELRVERLATDRQAFRAALGEAKARPAAGPAPAPAAAAGSPGAAAAARPGAASDKGGTGQSAASSGPVAPHAAPSAAGSTASPTSRYAGAGSGVVRCPAATGGPASASWRPLTATHGGAGQVAGPRAVVAAGAPHVVRPAASAGARPVGAAGVGPTASGAAGKPAGGRGPASHLPAESAARDANIEQIVRLIGRRLQPGRTHTVMRLAPPELGSLRLEMDLRGAALTLRLDTTTEVAHRLLSEELHRLRDGLAAVGIQLERIEVRPPASHPQPPGHAPPQSGDSSTGEGGPAPDGEHDERLGRDAERREESGKDSHPVEPRTEAGRSSLASAAASATGTVPVPVAEPPLNVMA